MPVDQAGEALIAGQLRPPMRIPAFVKLPKTIVARAPPILAAIEHAQDQL